MPEKMFHMDIGLIKFYDLDVYFLRCHNWTAYNKAPSSYTNLWSGHRSRYAD